MFCAVEYFKHFDKITVIEIPKPVLEMKGKVEEFDVEIFGTEKYI